MPARILVVDDEPQLERLILQRFRKNIRANEYDFSFARGGAEALEAISSSNDFDVVLSDINMPGMDGLTFIAKLNEIETRLKTVMVSAYGDMKNIRTAMNRGAYDFVTKPIDFHDLQTTIDKALREVEMHRLAEIARAKLGHIELELRVASEVQQSIIPKDFNVFPADSPFEMHAEMIPAREVGGDFYDFFKIDDTHLGVVIGDVCGKGMPSALLMAISRTVTKAVGLQAVSPGECLNQVNFILSQDNPRAMFVTLIYGILNLESAEFSFCNGGHNLPFLVNADGSVETVERNRNFVVGAVQEFNFSGQKITLLPGQSLVMYTDGITEAHAPDNEQFSDMRMATFLKSAPAMSPKQIVDGLVEQVQNFSLGREQFDDITALVIKYHE